MIDIDPLAIVFLAALIHASFQLSISVMVIMSGHALGKKASHTRVTSLTSSYSLGALVATLLLLSFVVLVLQNLFPDTPPFVTWYLVTGAAVATGVAVWALYYRYRSKGTVLWVPRSTASYLSKRARATQSPSEAFALGSMSIFAEILFVSIPIVVAALVLAYSPASTQLLGLGLYALVSAAPLAMITALVGGGHSLARIQRWREVNKYFLQFSSGSALIILGFYLYTDVLARSLQ